MRRTKIRGTLVRLRGRRGRRGRLAFVVPKSKRAAYRRMRGKRWSRSRVLFNPYSGGEGFLDTLKSVFSLDTLVYVGGTLAGVSVGAGAFEMAGNAYLSRSAASGTGGGSHGTYLAVGLGGGVLGTVATSYLVGKFSPRAGQLLFWGGLLGTVIRGLSVAFPGKTGLDMPKSAGDAYALAAALSSAPPAAVHDWLGTPAQLGARDWLGAPAQLGAREAGVYGTADFFDPSGQGAHPLVGAGQSW